MTLNFSISKIISGGQTGVDRAALDWAIAYGISHGGWCPQGRLAEDGVLDEKYQLDELENGSYRQRTKRNVMDSDATLILNFGELDGGTLATISFAQRLNKPYRIVQLESLYQEHDLSETLNWLVEHRVNILNVAGPRESKRPNIYIQSISYLTALYLFIQKQPLKNLRFHKKVYTIFVEPAICDWAWVKDVDDETMYVGKCVTWGCDWGGAHHVSKGLLDLVKFWLISLTPVVVNDENIATFDWKTFNERGLVIAQQLKAELGDKADVRYVKPDEDPTCNLEEGYEILSDGTILPIRRLWWMPV
jgi:hypothetical protein